MAHVCRYVLQTSMPNAGHLASTMQTHGGHSQTAQLRPTKGKQATGTSWEHAYLHVEVAVAGADGIERPQVALQLPQGRRVEGVEIQLDLIGLPVLRQRRRRPNDVQGPLPVS